MLAWSIGAVGLLFIADAAAQFSLYPSIDSDNLALALNISIECLTALNETVECDQTLFQMVGDVDGYFWEDDNATALCTSDCISAAVSWWSNAVDQCEDDQLNAYGKVSAASQPLQKYLHFSND
jgi:hypothetical protein